MNILFTICGRAGSKGFKNKNLKEMNGVPLVNYTLAVIKLYSEVHPEDHITIGANTDSQQLVNIIKQQDFAKEIQFVERKASLAGDFVAKVDVIIDTFYALNKKNGFDIVIDLDITSPMRKVKDIENVIKEFESDERYDIVTSVIPARRSPYFNMVEKKGDFYRKICSSNFVARQEVPLSFELNASIYAYSPLFLMKGCKKTILDNNCGISVMEDYLVLDIDSEEDFKMMEFLHKYYCKKDADLDEVYMIAKRIGRVDFK